VSIKEGSEDNKADVIEANNDVAINKNETKTMGISQ
jgi:hypothetical protein